MTATNTVIICYDPYMHVEKLKDELKSLQQDHDNLKEDHKTLNIYYRKYSQYIDHLKAQRALTNTLLEELKNKLNCHEGDTEIRKLLENLMRIR